MQFITRLRDVQNGMVIGKDVRTNLGVVILHRFSIVSANIKELLRTVWDVIPDRGICVFDMADITPTIMTKDCAYFLVADVLTSRKIDGVNQYSLAEAKKLLSVVLENNPYVVYNMYRLCIYHYDTLLHSLSVALISLMIGLASNCNFNQLINLALGATLHDIGKMQIPTSVLDKKGKLSDEEFDLIKKHPQFGYSIIQGAGFAQDILDIIVQHHEKITGKGYPFGLKGNVINPLSKIVTVADIFEAVTAKRSYHNKRYNFDGFKIIDAEPGLEPTIVQYVHQNIALLPKDSKVVLSDDDYAIVMQDCGTDKPLVYMTQIKRVVDLKTTGVAVKRVVGIES